MTQPPKLSETAIQHAIMAETGALPGVRLFANHQGIAIYRDGSRVRYGVGGDGGSDLVGWVSVVITPEMVGTTIARFVAAEQKTPRGRTAKRRQQLQQNFIDAVNRDGGTAGRCRSVDDAVALIARARAP